MLCTCQDSNSFAMYLTIVQCSLCPVVDVIVLWGFELYTKCNRQQLGGQRKECIMMLLM